MYREGCRLFRRRMCTVGIQLGMIHRHLRCCLEKKERVSTLSLRRLVWERDNERDNDLGKTYT